MLTSERMLASDLYAMAHTTKNEGLEECHWCSAPCKQLWIHDDLPPIPFTRSNSTARRPANHFICIGCWRWHWKFTSVRFLNGDMIDRQSPKKHSWWITKNDARTIRDRDYKLLYELLLKPPTTFCLCLILDGYENLLQSAIVNNNEIVKADTQLRFTINNIPHTYTCYDLENALTADDPSGLEPGVTSLIRFLGPYNPTSISEMPGGDKKKAIGRPTTKNGKDHMDGRSTKKVMAARLSGG